MGWGAVIGAAVSVAGSAMDSGGGSEGGVQADTSFATEAHDEALGFLDQALQKSLPYTEMFTQKAIENMQQQYAKANLETKRYFEIAQAQTAPYRQAGYQANDMLQDTLGIARSPKGSAAMAAEQERAANERATRAQLGMQAMQTGQQMGMSPEDLQKFYMSSTLGNNPANQQSALRQYQLLTAQPKQAATAATGGGAPKSSGSGNKQWNGIGAMLRNTLDKGLGQQDEATAQRQAQAMAERQAGYDTLHQGTMDRFGPPVDPRAAYMANTAPMNSELLRLINAKRSY